ncbi:prepilin-type N-terminal cleavage/methylation domain-containing protein, partial [Desulfovirgula thermocuniculi]|uniref:prepilin-type N-terminal cleavage/methylation domain-containing protein n=1 Tax=Desulfovirgula thermocuniculi TaxID=348842 RepID=UPI003CCBC226
MRRVSFALNDDRGFSLASVVVAMALLAVAAALVGALLAGSVKAHRASAEGQTAAHLA